MNELGTGCGAEVGDLWRYVAPQDARVLLREYATAVEAVEAITAALVALGRDVPDLVASLDDDGRAMVVTVGSEPELLLPIRLTRHAAHEMLSGMGPPARQHKEISGIDKAA